MNQYETVFILTPVLSDEQMKETVAKFEKVLTDNGAEILNKEAWGFEEVGLQHREEDIRLLQLG